MLYYIVPPIIIIASISILVWFLFRKASLIPENNVPIENKDFYSSKVRSFFFGIGHLFLAVVEIIIRKAKLVSLKFHNMSNDWVQAIRRKRENARVKKESIDQPVVFDKDGSINDIETLKKETDIQDEFNNSRLTFSRQQRIRRTGPMISDTVTLPEKKIASETVKEKLEDVLIKRIAMNPRDIEAYERLGDYYMEQGSAKDSLECYRQVLKLSPVHTKAKLKIRRLEKMLR
jgi:tetratricopeptide (TPR) repeat protein